ncbi:hypothetical protein ACFV4P_35130 [Kitasatospora sp. NPDC059795]|uniref:hypothetical protein n=1 Tax=Kitasatospora sp. NPDC059795 TaxID=3346949 RepID=UPI00364C059D
MTDESTSPAPEDDAGASAGGTGGSATGGSRVQSLVVWLGVATSVLTILTWLGFSNWHQVTALLGPSGEPSATAAPPPPPPPTVTGPASSSAAAQPSPSPPEPQPSSPSSVVPTHSPTATVQVRWHGKLTLDDGSANGMPTTGWSLDPVPPQRAPLGDLGLACGLVCEPGQLVGNTIVLWEGPSVPDRPGCADLLDSHPGQRTVDVQTGSVACFGTNQMRVGYFKVLGSSGGRQTLEVTVWQTS